MAGLLGVAAAAVPAMTQGINQGFSTVVARMQSEQNRLTGSLGHQAAGGSQGVRDAGAGRPH